MEVYASKAGAMEDRSVSNEIDQSSKRTSFDVRMAVRNIAEYALSKFPVTMLSRFHNAIPHIFVYHTVFDTSPDHFSNLYKVRGKRGFEDDLDAILNVYAPLSFAEFMSGGMTKSSRRPVCLLTFDDNNRELYDTIAPMLERKGVPAIFFVCSAFLNNSSWFFEDQCGLINFKVRGNESANQRFIKYLKKEKIDWQKLVAGRLPQPRILNAIGSLLEIDWESELSDRKPYLTDDNIHSLLRRGFAIGAHGIDHRVFSSLSVADQIKQVAESVTAIQSKFNIPYRAFAFPYGDFGITKRTLLELRDTGLVDFVFGTRGLIEDELSPFVLQRLWCENREQPLSQFIARHLASIVYGKFRGYTAVRRNV